MRYSTKCFNARVSWLPLQEIPRPSLSIPRLQPLSARQSISTFGMQAWECIWMYRAVRFTRRMETLWRVWFEVPDSTAKSVSVSTALKGHWNQFGAATPERTNAIATFPGSMEVMAHFVAGDDATALSLIRLEWGYMLSSPKGTGSTFWEGYLQDGSFDYDPAYMSLAHGWATGPTPALTNYVAGIGPELSSRCRFTLSPIQVI